MNPLNRLGELLEDWKFLLRRDGVRNAAPVIGIELIRLPYRRLRFVILARDLSDPLPVFQPKIPLEIRPFEPTDLKFAQTIDRPSEARLCQRRLERGQAGFVAITDGQIAGYAWGCIQMDPQLERVTFDLLPGDFLCTDVFTVPAWRGRGNQTALTLARLEHFKALGYQRAICYIEQHNAPSLAVWQRKLESTTLGWIDFTRAGSHYQVRYQWSNGYATGKIAGITE